MLRSLFFAMGLFVTMWGGTLLIVDKIVLTTDAEVQEKTGFRGFFQSTEKAKKRVIDPPDWAAFSLLSVGSVTILYSIALPKKNAEAH